MEDYFVVLFDSYTSTVPKSWLNFVKKTVLWPPRPIPSKLGMQNMIPDEKWIAYKWKKIMGPYGNLYCIKYSITPSSTYMLVRSSLRHLLHTLDRYLPSERSLAP